MAISPIQIAGPTLPAAPAPPSPPSISVGKPSFSSSLSSALGRGSAPTAGSAAATQAGNDLTSAALSDGSDASTDLTGGTRVLDGTSGAASVAGVSGGGAGVQARPGTYSHLNGDLDAHPELLAKLEALAARRGETFHVTSGNRTYDEQMRLWNNRGNNPYPVARPGTSRHESGRAADVTIGGRAIQDVIPAAELRAAGLAPLAGDAVHVELP